ncbi:DmpA family aminopeptidase [Sphingosinicella rhizophila]|uniref:P1 family peptidase n=1 Tax=Sphingosinicella rhizophila TaxID=3050082 RepID=A0ABU3Q6V7_9SPHN|nr:P1 family peptidase [Sphingosinicella sp. GR2756]MDT9599137.1 P1 family peptidase [Sphingosinicella sp. GR2756]
MIRNLVATSLAALLSLALPAAAPAQSDGAAQPARARDLGVPFHGEPGRLNAITDVAGVEVGHVTLISGTGPLRVGEGPVRTGVTAVLPRGKASTAPVFAAWSTLNAAGEMTGTVWLDERGLLDGPVMITNTHSVGVVRDATIGWMVDKGWDARWFVPLVAETYDGVLNDINGFHVKAEHARQALDAAKSGPVAEGAVGGGTGMICNRFKGGIGTASRLVRQSGKSYTIGVLVQCNYGDRAALRIAGAPIGAQLADTYLPCKADPAIQVTNPVMPAGLPACRPAAAPGGRAGDGSIIIIVATDAPLLPHQLKRLSKRAGLGLGRLGSVASAGSGDIFVAFSTANANVPAVQAGTTRVELFSNEELTPLFEATVDATEEAVVNAMVAARDMTGADGFKVFGLPHDAVRAAMRKWKAAGAASR